MNRSSTIWEHATPRAVTARLPQVLLLAGRRSRPGILTSGPGVPRPRNQRRETWPDGLTLLDGGTGGLHLLDYLSSDEPLVMIDATMDGQPAGTVCTLRPEYASGFPCGLTAHEARDTAGEEVAVA